MVFDGFNWITLTLLSALFGAFALIYKKKGLEHEHSLEYLGVFKVFEFLMILPFAFIVPLNFPIRTYALMYILSIFITFALLLENKGFRRMEFTKYVPLFNIKTIITLIASMIILEEYFTWQQIGGIGLIMFGLYKAESQHSIRDMFTHIKQSKGMLFSLSGIIILGIAAVFEKQLLLETHIISYLLIMYFFSVINTLFALTIFYDGYKGIIHGIKNEGKTVLLASFFATVSNLLFLAAISGAYLAIVEALKKSSNIIAMVVGGRYFHEKDYLRRVAWTSLVIVGIFFII